MCVFLCYALREYVNFFKVRFPVPKTETYIPLKKSKLCRCTIILILARDELETLVKCWRLIQVLTSNWNRPRKIVCFGISTFFFIFLIPFFAISQSTAIQSLCTDLKWVMFIKKITNVMYQRIFLDMWNKCFTNNNRNKLRR